MGSKLAAVDCETTGTDPDRHEVWEVAVLLSNTDDTDHADAYLWQLDVDLSTADPMALTIGHYWERHVTAADLSSGPTMSGSMGALRVREDGVGEDGALAAHDGVTDTTDPERLARWLAVQLADASIIGANPGFDMAFLRRLLRRWGRLESWRYRPIDVEGMAMDRLGLMLPTKLSETASLLGIEREGAAHSALSDARLAWDCYRHLTSTEPRA